MPLTNVTVSATNKTSGIRKVSITKTESLVLLDASLQTGSDICMRLITRQGMFRYTYSSQ